MMTCNEVTLDQDTVRGAGHVLLRVAAQPHDDLDAVLAAQASLTTAQAALERLAQDLNTRLERNQANLEQDRRTFRATLNRFEQARLCGEGKVQLAAIREVQTLLDCMVFGETLTRFCHALLEALDRGGFNVDDTIKQTIDRGGFAELTNGVLTPALNRRLRELAARERK